MNYLPFNIFMATLSLLSGFLYSVIPVKRLARGEFAFHYVILSCRDSLKMHCHFLRY